MFRFPLRAAAALSFLLPALATAQIPITLKGTIDELQGGGCDPAATHSVRCTEVLLHSSMVDLNALRGQTVDLRGTMRLSASCISIDVTEAEPATVRTVQLAPLGTRLGRPVLLTSFTPPGSTIFYYWSAAPGFLPLGPFGTMLVDPLSGVLIGSNLSIGIDLRTETIPNDPSLVGATLRYQFGYLSLLTGLELGFLNPGCVTIQR